MSNIIPAILQNRRGKRQRLPQPLLPGELGFCVDTNELFIGSDPSDPSSVTYPYIHVYDAYVGGNIQGIDPNDAQFSDMVYTKVANKILDEYIIQVDPTNPSQVSNYDNILNYSDVTGATTEPVKIVSNRYDSNGVVTASRIFIARGAPLSPSDVNQGGLLSRVGDNFQFQGVGVDLSGIEVNTLEYSVEDSHAIAQLINFVFDNSGDFITATGHGTGLVTVGQNIQVYTESDRPASEKQLTVQNIIPNNSDRSTGLWYSLHEDDVFSLTYSVKSDNYVRSGKLLVSFLNYEAILTDDHQEMYNAPMTEPPSLTFWATTVGDVADEVVEIRYSASGLEDDTVLSAHTLRWKSF